MKVEYDNLTPLYDQVKRLILSDIKVGRYQAGTYLPSETELCDQYAVSRITLRRAVSELSSSGYLRKVHGRGTLITEPKLKQALVSLTGFKESFETLGHEVRYKVLESSHNPNLTDIRAKLKGRAEEQIVGIRRLLLINDRPLTVEQLYFLRDRYGKAAEPVKEGKSFYEALKFLYGEQPKGAERTINVDFPSQAECSLLACATSQPIYRIEKIVLGKGDRPISLSVLTTPTDRVSYSISV